MFYLAGPYAHEDPKIMDLRFQKLTTFAGGLMSLGIEVYSPITHNHPIALSTKLPRDWSFWKRFDLPMLDRSELLYVLKLEGWDRSIGVTAEIAHCRATNKPVYFIEPV